MKLLRNARTLFSSLRNTFQTSSAQGPAPVPPTPPFILMETTNACNLRCRMCFLYGEGIRIERKIGFLQKSVWMQAIDEMGRWADPVTLDLHGAGEPLLHQDLFDIVSYAKQNSNISAGFLCNATLLSQEKARAVIETKLDWIGFSVDGAQKDIFEYYRKGAVLEEVEANIEYLLHIRKEVMLNMVMHPEADAELFINKWKGRVDLIQLSLKRINDRKRIPSVIIKFPCPLLSQQLIMGYDGRTVLCCEDFYADHVTGEFPARSLQEIWLGKALARARNLHAAGKYTEIELCRHCDASVFHMFDQEEIVVDGHKTIVRRELPSAISCQ
jgi:uncharacterized Fe-S cluster-containing radical SAM superfamily protein